jgi:mono/diheme cytochrome c family protein
MKKVLKVLGMIVGAAVVAVVAFLTYFNLKYPDVDPAPMITVERTAERLARGKYLAHHVTVCIDCHSTRDWTKFSGPVISGTEGKGGEEFPEAVGTLVSSNITPAAIAQYTDGELLRAFTVGVTRDGRAMFPLMPYPMYSKLTEADAYAIVAYTRSLSPIENKVKESTLNFPLNFIVKTIPQGSFNPSSEPDKNNPAEYGKYLTTIAACEACHTPRDDKGQNLPGMTLAGGNAFPFPGGTVRALNITPDNETGIGNWTKEDFLARFRSFIAPEAMEATLAPTDFNTPMPWTMYAGMTDEDLGAIYEYLRTIPAVKNQVEKFTPQTP